MKSAVVTGGASGIGLASARHLAAAGWYVAVIDAAPAELAGDRFRVALGDVTEEAGFAAALTPLLEGWPPLKGLVNCAGIARDVPLMATDAALLEHYSIWTNHGASSCQRQAGIPCELTGRIESSPGTLPAQG